MASEPMSGAPPSMPSAAIATVGATGHGLPTGLSLYLDLVRFGAALMVLTSHLSLFALTPRPLVLPNFGHDGVLIFFVMSGVVIAAAAARPGMSFGRFVTARAVRLYSVALAAIAFSYGVAGIGVQVAGQSFGALFSATGGVWNVVSSALYLNESWLSTREVPWNGPYWSLCYEAWYYLIFGAAMLLQGRARFLWPVAFAIVAGPRVLILMPVWLAGVGLWRLLPRAPCRPMLGAVLWLLSAAAIAAFDYFQLGEAIRDCIGTLFPAQWHLRRSELFAGDYLIGAAVFVNFAAWALLGAAGARVLGALARPIRFAAGYTFSIYLFHYPLVLFISRTMHYRAATWADSTVVLAAILAVCVAIGSVTERRRDDFMRLLRRRLAR